MLRYWPGIRESLRVRACGLPYKNDTIWTQSCTHPYYHFGTGYELVTGGDGCLTRIEPLQQELRVFVPPSLLSHSRPCIRPSCVCAVSETVQKLCLCYGFFVLGTNPTLLREGAPGSAGPRGGIFATRTKPISSLCRSRLRIVCRSAPLRHSIVCDSVDAYLFLLFFRSRAAILVFCFGLACGFTTSDATIGKMVLGAHFSFSLMSYPQVALASKR